MKKKIVIGLLSALIATFSNSFLICPLASAVKIAAKSDQSKVLSPLEELEQADNLLDERDIDAAVSIYQKLTTAFKSDEDKAKLRRVYRKLGIAYALSERYDKAIENFEFALTLADRSNPNDIHSIVSIDYSLAKAYQSTGQLDKALASCQSALILAKTKMSDSHYVIRRLFALKTELSIANAAKQIDLKEQKAIPEKVEQLTAKPLVGGVSSTDYFKAPQLISEVPSLDGARKQAMQLKAAKNSGQTTLTSGATKAKSKMVQKLMEYGTMGLSLKKELKAWPWYVKHVMRGGAGERYGVKDGDKLDSIDGHPILSLPITRIYHMLCGRRGELRTLGITRGGRKMYIRVRLVSVYEIGYKPSQYIEYYWFLLYNGYITNADYARLAAPWNKYFP